MRRDEFPSTNIDERAFLPPSLPASTSLVIGHGPGSCSAMILFAEGEGRNGGKTNGIDIIQRTLV